MGKSKLIAGINPAKKIIEDNLTEFVRKSANQMLRIAIEEVSEFISKYSQLITSEGKLKNSA